MRRTIAVLFLLWIAGILLEGCADERHVVKTPVPPEPAKNDALPRR